MLALLMLRHGEEVEATIGNLAQQKALEAMVQPYLDQGLSEEAVVDTVLKDLQRAARNVRQHKAH